MSHAGGERHRQVALAFDPTHEHDISLPLVLKESEKGLLIERVNFPPSGWNLYLTLFLIFNDRKCLEIK